MYLQVFSLPDFITKLMYRFASSSPHLRQLITTRQFFTNLVAIMATDLKPLLPKEPNLVSITNPQYPSFRHLSFDLRLILTIRLLQHHDLLLLIIELILYSLQSSTYLLDYHQHPSTIYYQVLITSTPLASLNCLRSQILFEWSSRSLA